MFRSILIASFWIAIALGLPIASVAQSTLPPEYGPVDPFLAAPARDSLYVMPVVIIRYLPTADSVNLDVSINPDYWTLGPILLADMKKRIDTFDKRVKFMLEEGSKFRGYKNPAARPSVGYKVVAYITVYEITPRGKVINMSNGYPVYNPDYHQIFARFNMEHYVNDLGVKEIWFWSSGMDAGYPSYNPAIHKPENFRGGGWESNMSSPVTGDISNSNRDDSDLPVYNTTYIVYGQNFRRTQAEAVHNHGHQLEHMLSHVNWLQDGNFDLFWKRFVGQDESGKFITGRCGWTHMPPNTTVDYDYNNLTLVDSDIEDWTPEGSGQKKPFSALTYGSIPYAWPDGKVPEQQVESQWYIYWMQSMPGFANTIKNLGMNLTNWWTFTANWDASIRAKLGLYGLTKGDFNSDGKPDLLWQHQSSGQIGVWFLNGTTLSSPNFFTPGQVPDTHWKIVARDDFNGDSKPDLVWQHQITGQIGVWFLNGTTQSSWSYFTPGAIADASWKIVAADDFNSDSKPDLVWQHQTTGQIVVWFMNGISLTGFNFFNPPQVPDTNWRITGTGDFNSDGKPDLVWQNQATGQIGVWLMNGTALSRVSFFTPNQVSDTKWKIVGVSDFNADNKPDLVWQNQADGQIGVWFMNGTSLSSVSLFDPSKVTDTDWRIPQIWNLVN